MICEKCGIKITSEKVWDIHLKECKEIVEDVKEEVKETKKAKEVEKKVEPKKATKKK